MKTLFKSAGDSEHNRHLCGRSPPKEQTAIRYTWINAHFLAWVGEPFNISEEYVPPVRV